LAEKDGYLAPYEQEWEQKGRQEGRQEGRLEILALLDEDTKKKLKLA
jgi:predicted transposase YdaD